MTELIIHNMPDLAKDGWTKVRTNLVERELQTLRDSIFREDGPGQRCLLDLPAVQQTACALRSELIGCELLPTSAIAIQAIAFDKTPTTNWKVPWHQDVMFPFAKTVTAENYHLPSVKNDIAYARPPQSVLEDLLAVRLHLDDCGDENGPLRVSPGSHRQGILKAAEFFRSVARNGDTTCLAKSGEALLMKPLLLHASSVATAPQRRRVLHLVYHSGVSTAEAWHRAI